MNRPKSIRDLLDLPGGKPAETYREAVRPQPDTSPPPPEAEPPPADDSPPSKKSDPLPRPGDSYRAHARFLNRLSSDQHYLHFVDRECFSIGFSYHDLRRVSWADAGRPGVGPALVLHFVDWQVTEVRIEGRNLDDVRHWIGEGMMPWLWEQPGGFKIRDDTAVVITGFVFREFEK